MTCKIFLETGDVPIECLFKCTRDCVFEEQPIRSSGGPTCKRCGSTDVRWRLQGGRWVLFSDKPGIVHVCERPKAQDEFK